MDSEVRHDLEKNSLASWLTHTIQRIRPYLPHLSLAAVALVVAAVIYVSLSAAGREKQREAWADLARATSPAGIEQVLADHPGSPLVPFGDLRLGWIRYNEGKEKIIDDRGEAIRLLDEATDYFDKVKASSSADGAVKSQALLGTALVHECQGKVDDAKTTYQEIADRYKGQPVAQVAQYRIDLLNKPDAGAFFAALKNYQPPAPTTDLPEKIDAGLDLDTSNPAAPEIPTSLDFTAPVPSPDPTIPAPTVPTTPETPPATPEPAPPKSEEPAPPKAEEPSPPKVEEPEPPKVEETAPPKAEEPAKPEEPAPQPPTP